MQLHENKIFNPFTIEISIANHLEIRSNRMDFDEIGLFCSVTFKCNKLVELKILYILKF